MIRVFKHWMLSRTLLNVSFDVLFVIAVTATAILWKKSGLPIDITATLVYTAILGTVMVMINTWFGLYQNTHERSIYQNIARALLALYISVPIAYLIFSLLPFAEADRTFFEITLMTAMYGMLANRVRAFHAPLPNMITRRVLIFGVGSKARAAYESLLKSDPDIVVVGFLASPVVETPNVPTAMILPEYRSLSETARTLKVQEIVVAVNERRGGVMPLKELLDCKLTGIEVLDLSTHFEHRLGQIRLDSLKAGWLVFGDGFSQGAVRTFSKRVFDIVCSSILLLLSMPTMLLAAMLIVIESGFPIFYRQERVGLNGKVFSVLKFRSMRTDAEKDGKPRFASARDSRITRVGMVLRKMRIDETPQLLSVLKGDMSLVGPRPERPFFVEQLTKEVPFYAVRHSIKPGLTGWAQVRYHYGASMDDSSQKLQYDLYYVKNHSLFLDAVILFETVGVVLAAKGA